MDSGEFNDAMFGECVGSFWFGGCTHFKSSPSSANVVDVLGLEDAFSLFFCSQSPLQANDSIAV